MSTSATEFAITAPTVFDGEGFLQNHCVIVQGETVAQVIPAVECPAELDKLVLESGTLAPGFIDLQVNGGGGLMFNNAPTSATLDIMLTAHRASGSTSILPTVMSDTPAVQGAAAQAVRHCGQPGIAGIHIEGPFFDHDKRGAHQAQMIRPLLPADMEWLCSLRDLQVMLTLAPEHTRPGQIEHLVQSGIAVLAGHTAASYQQLCDATAQGLQGVTHLFNAMSPLTSREPGVVGAALDNDALWAGIIADGHHVHPASIRLAYQAKPAGKLVLASDAMATVGTDLADFELYGETICEKEGRLVNAAGALAGSAIGMIDAVRYSHQSVEIPQADCLRMASLYPAAILGRDDNIGRIAAGFRADLVHFDRDFRVHNTWVSGQRTAHGQSV
jgi:N-acetylglucosamine-6-phosphate deacetylase